MNLKQIFLFALCLSLSFGTFQASAQLGKKLKAKMGKLAGGGEIDKDKLPGPYYTSNIPLSLYFNGTYPASQDFYLEEGEGSVLFKRVRKDREASKLFVKKRNKPNLSNGDVLYQAGRTSFYVDVTGKGEDFKTIKALRSLKIKENVFLFYALGLDDEINELFEGGTEGYIKDHSKIKIWYVLAPTQELATEWNSEKGLKRIYAAEDGVKAVYLSKMKGEIADVRMPKPGKMNSNTALRNKIKSQITTQLTRDGATLKRLMITANDWEIVRNKITGEILYRHIWGYLADSNPDRGEIPCMVFGFYYTEKYQGNGKYAEGNGKVDCCSQDPKYGPYIACENINK